jgi:NTP pyrophosphatase (non-canonical NTP hydrolase)
MEHFQWIDTEASRRAADRPAARAAIGEELADVLSYVLALANSLDLDLATTFTAKLAKNRQKYPAEQYKGKYALEG